jgi:hypothetical protein
MKTAAHPFRFAALAGLALILPFAIMQVINVGVRRDDAPDLIVLFGLLWLLPALSIASGLRMLRPPAGSDTSRRSRIVIAAVISIAATALWGGLLADQMPCFLGVPNCD